LQPQLLMSLLLLPPHLSLPHRHLHRFRHLLLPFLSLYSPLALCPLLACLVQVTPFVLHALSSIPVWWWHAPTRHAQTLSPAQQSTRPVTALLSGA
jgi:hypothetical protein